MGIALRIGDTFPMSKAMAKLHDGTETRPNLRRNRAGLKLGPVNCRAPIFKNVHEQKPLLATGAVAPPMMGHSNDLIAICSSKQKITLPHVQECPFPEKVLYKDAAPSPQKARYRSFGIFKKWQSRARSVHAKASLHKAIASQYAVTVFCSPIFV
jgi:hypothetical protein